MLSGDLEPWVTQTVLREFQNPTTDYRPMLDERVLPLHKAMGKLTAASLGTEDRRASDGSGGSRRYGTDHGVRSCTPGGSRRAWLARD